MVNTHSSKYVQLTKYGCHYVSIEVWAYEPRILDTYGIVAYTIDTFNGYSVCMFYIHIL